MANLNLKELLQLTAEKSASDLHLIADNPPTLRIYSRLKRTDLPVLTEEETKSLIYSILTPEQKAELEKERELDIAYEFANSRFRINVHYERGRVAGSFRRIPRKIPAFDELGVPKRVADFANRDQGLVLVTGPTGCGKSTTQAAMIDKVNHEESLHIITVEDPIEYIYDNRKSVIEQREVGSDTLSFANALKRALREDPDLILVGEMRDLETIQAVLTAAETGHVVISTLHTQDASQAIDRMVDVFPPHQQAQVRLQLSLTLKGVLAQRLLPRKDGKGVAPAFEILVANPAIRNLIRKAQSHEIYSMMEIGTSSGMQTLEWSLKELYDKGIIDYDTAVNAAPNTESIERLLKGKGKSSSSGGESKTKFL